jgi:hypothetical protein
MAHCYTDQVRRDAVQTKPGAEGAAEVVGAYGLDAGALAGLREVTASVAPGSEQEAVLALGVAL